MPIRYMTVLLGIALLTSVSRADQPTVAQILQTYADDYAHDPSAHAPITFGIRVAGEGGGEWHVAVSKESPGATETTVVLKEGFPKEPTFFFTTDVDALRKIHTGKMNGLTAMAKEFYTDKTPMDIDTMPGFAPGGDFVSVVIPLSFHFWTRGFPERVPFGTGLTRKTHGANAAVFYYQPGLRSAWVQIDKGQHANANPQSQTNPFPTMLIGLKGECKAKISGETSDMKAGEMMFIPPNITHEFWNPNEQPFEAILLMFGEGA